MLPLVPLSVNKVQANHINCTNWHGDFDADCDGLSDAWELIDRYTEDGTGINVALPGADPNHKDIYVEIDYMSHHIPPTTTIISLLLNLILLPLSYIIQTPHTA